MSKPRKPRFYWLIARCSSLAALALNDSMTPIIQCLNPPTFLSHTPERHFIYNYPFATSSQQGEQ
jgi:hypothetical protein